MTHKLKSIILSIRYGISNLVKWLPVIWKDRDWDQHSLYEILGLKLSKMSEFHRNYGTSTDSESVSEQLLHASQLCDKIINYDYSDEALQEFKRKYPEFELEMNLTPTENGAYLSHYNLDDMPQELQELYHKHYKIDEELQHQDRKQLFDILCSNIDNWWD